MDTSRYAPKIAELLAVPGQMRLDAGMPDRAAADRLRRLDIVAAFAPVVVRDPVMARACLSGLWLRFNHLDESHGLSQGLHSPEGSYWHAIMHRREGDFGNAKYWFRRVGSHPTFEPLAAAARGLAADMPGAFTAETWDPFAFVDLCEACVNGSSPHAELCRQVQRREWELLFEYCYRQAVAG